MNTDTRRRRAVTALGAVMYALFAGFGVQGLCMWMRGARC